MSRRPRDERRRPAQRPFLERYGYRIASALVVLGVILVGGYIYLQASRPAFACTSQLTPPPATPTPAATATPRPTPVPTPSPTPSPTATPEATPTPEPSPGATAGPTTTPKPTPTAEPTPTPLPTPWVGFEVIDRGRIHVSPGTTIQFDECPPTSGPHYSEPAKRGYYAPDQNLPVGAWVHSLEHGMVVVLYSCGRDGSACPDQATLEALHQLAETAPQTEVAASVCGIRNKIIVARFDQMSTRFAAIGWERALLSDTYDPETFLTFYGQWVDNSPTEEARECDGRVGAE